MVRVSQPALARGYGDADPALDLPVPARSPAGLSRLLETRGRPVWRRIPALGRDHADKDAARTERDGTKGQTEPGRRSNPGVPAKRLESLDSPVNRHQRG